MLKLRDSCKRLCKEKQACFAIELANSFQNVRDSKGFWALANKFMYTVFSCVANNEPREWVSNFHILLNIEGETSPTVFVFLLIRMLGWMG